MPASPVTASTGAAMAPARRASPGSTAAIWRRSSKPIATDGAGIPRWSWIARQLTAATAGCCFRLLCGAALRPCGDRHIRCAGCYRHPLPSRRSRARPRLLRLVPRNTGRRHRPRQPAARRPARRLSRRAARPVAHAARGATIPRMSCCSISRALSLQESAALAAYASALPGGPPRPGSPAASPAARRADPRNDASAPPPRAAE